MSTAVRQKRRVRPARKGQAGPTAPGATRVRRSVVSGERAQKDSLLRIVLGPDGTPGVDLSGRAPGRGAYVEPDRDALLEALSPKGLGRAFKGGARALEKGRPEALVQDTRLRLEARILDLIGLARRAGQLSIGVDPVASAVGPGWAVVIASDLAQGSAEALNRALGAQSDVTVARLAINKVGLGARLGKVDVAAVAIMPSTLADRLAVEAARYERLGGGAAVSRAEV